MNLIPASTVATRLGVSAGTVRRMCAAGEIAHVIRSGRYYVPADVLKSLTVSAIVPPKERVVPAKREVVMGKGKYSVLKKRGKKGTYYSIIHGNRHSWRTTSQSVAWERYQEFTRELPSGCVRDKTLGDWLTQWRKLHNGWRPEALRDYEKTYKTIGERWGHLHLSRIGYAEIKTYLEECRAAGNTGRTCNKKRQHIRQLLAEAVEMGYLAAMPRLPHTYAQDDSVERQAATDNQVAALLALADKEARDFRVYAYLLVYAGLRDGEARSLTWEAVDLKARALTVVAGKSKNRHPVIKPLHRRLYEVLAEVPGISGKIIGYEAWYYHSRVKTVGITAHQVRHWFGTVCASNPDATVADVADALGHSKASHVTLRYIHARSERVRKMIQNIEVGGKT